jgi:hypothetical protein
MRFWRCRRIPDVPVECEVDNCGVLAIGRCKHPTCEVRGGAAFCRSHNYAGQCTLCFRAADRRENAVRTAIDTARGKMHRIAAALVAAGVQPDGKYVDGTTSKEVRAGLLWMRTKTITVKDPVNDRYGWLLGVYPWLVKSRAYDGRESEHSSKLRTYLTVEGDLAAESGQRGNIDDGIPYAYLRGENEIRFWEGLAAAAADVAARHGVRDLD